MRIYTLGTAHGDSTWYRHCSSTLYETADGALYLIDCGAPAEALVRRKGLLIRDIRALFITHMHEDHVGGLTGIVKNTLKYPGESDRPLILHFPEEKAIEPFRNWLFAMHINADRPLLAWAAVQEGPFYEDENVAVRAIRTRHLTDKDGNPLSFAYHLHFKAENLDVLHSGDLRGDFADFPKEPLTQHFDACVCEATHYRPESARDTLAQCRFGQLIFTHVSDRWHNYPQSGPYYVNNEKKLLEAYAGKLPYPVRVAHDGDEFLL